MQKVISENIWGAVSVKANGHPMMVAVAFVTDLGLLKLRRGDVLICDASDGNVSAGIVDRNLIARLVRKGVDVYSNSALHAKCDRFGRRMKYTMIGSSNLSQNSANDLEELALMTDDIVVGAKVHARMQSWIDQGEKVTAGLLKRMMGLPKVAKHFGRVNRNSHGKKDPAVRKCSGRDESKVWVLGTQPCDCTWDMIQGWSESLQWAS